MNSEERKSWTQKELLFLLLIIGAGILLRFLLLGERALHHDESLHATYGKYFFENPNEKFYRYDPVLHGPLLYNLLPYLYQLFDVTIWAGRFMIAVIGSFFIFVPLIFRKYFKKETIILLTTLISLSPSLIYWSRFLREDFLVVFSMFLIVWGTICVKSLFKPIVILSGIALHFCIKENSYITLALLLAYLLFEFFFFFFQKKELEKTLLSSLLRFIKENPLQVILGFLVASFIFCYFYSSGFRYGAGILDGLYRKGFLYWLGQHHVDRIKGPFIFHLINMTWYDFIFVLLFLGATIHFYIKASLKYLVAVAGAFLLAFICHIKTGSSVIEADPLFSLMKIKISADFYLFFFLIAHALTTTIYHLRRNEKSLAFFSYFFFATFFTYSYVGEKVPWLTIYPFVAGLIYVSLYIERKTSLLSFSFSYNACAMALIVLFNFRMSLVTNFSRAGEESEFISQVHTTKMFHQMMLKIKDDILIPYKKPSPKILVLDDAVWPATWYFIGLNEYQFIKPKAQEWINFDYVVSNVENLEAAKALLKTHERQIIPLRGWWVPTFEKMGLAGIIKYALSHNPPTATGHLEIAYYTKKN